MFFFVRKKRKGNPASASKKDWFTSAVHSLEYGKKEKKEKKSNEMISILFCQRREGKRRERV